jgi:hypothetical protein
MLFHTMLFLFLYNHIIAASTAIITTKTKRWTNKPCHDAPVPVPVHFLVNNINQKYNTGGGSTTKRKGDCIRKSNVTASYCIS